LAIPNTWTWTWTWSAMFPINLVFRLIFDKKLKETSLPVIWLKYWLWKIRVGSVRNEWLWLILVGVLRERLDRFLRKRFDKQVPLVEVEEEIRVHWLGFASNWQCDLKKWKNIIHSSWSIDHHFLTLHWLGNRIFTVITDYLPFVN
jgi:hypothetical protein